MPEGDSAHRAARRLHAAHAGRILTRCELRVPSAALVDLTGQVVHEVTAHGKHILHHIGEWTVRSHLRMEGEWHIQPEGSPWRKPSFQARAVIAADGVEAVGFSLGMLDAAPRAEEHTLIGHLGPDPLRSDWDGAEAERRLAADPRPAHVALLDQRRVAGFGTEYVAELLFLRGIDPRRPLVRAEIAPLLDLGSRTMLRNVEEPMRSFTGDRRRGRRMWVYGRGRKPCRRCGSMVLEGTQGPDPTRERRMFWCPRCQR